MASQGYLTMTQEEIERYLHLNYIVIVGDSATDLEKRVNEVPTMKHFAVWEPIGGVAVTYVPDSANDYATVRFYQAMRKVK